MQNIWTQIFINRAILCRFTSLSNLCWVMPHFPVCVKGILVALLHIYQAGSQGFPFSWFEQRNLFVCWCLYKTDLGTNLGSHWWELLLHLNTVSLGIINSLIYHSHLNSFTLPSFNRTQDSAFFLLWNNLNFLWDSSLLPLLFSRNWHDTIDFLHWRSVPYACLTISSQ